MRPLIWMDARMLALHIAAEFPQLPDELACDVECWGEPTPLQLAGDVLLIDGHIFSVKELRGTLARLSSMLAELPEQLVLFGGTAR